MHSRPIREVDTFELVRTAVFPAVVALTAGAIGCAAAPRGAAGAGAVDAADAFAAIPVPDGVADPGGDRIYVTDVGGEVVALETATGRPLWRLPGPARALVAASGDLVVARLVEVGQPSLQVGVIATRDGAVRRWSPPAKLPFGEWSVAGPVRIESGTLVLPWQTIRAAPPTGMLMTEELYKRRHDPHAGVARVRLAAGGVDIGDGVEDPIPPAIVRSYHAINQNEGTAPWFMSGRVLAMLWHENRGSERWAMLRTFDLAGRERFTRALFPDPGGGVVQALARGAGIVARLCTPGVTSVTCRHVSFETESARPLPDVPAAVAESAPYGLGRDKELAWASGVCLAVKMRGDAGTGAPPGPPPDKNADQTVDARRFLVGYDGATWTAQWEQELRPFHQVFYAPRP